MNRAGVKRAGAASLVVGLFALFGLLRAKPHLSASPQLTIEPKQLAADGYDSATLRIAGRFSAAPRITLDPPHAASVQELTLTEQGWQTQLRAGVTPATVTVRVDAPEMLPARATFVTALDAGDASLDGTPDFLRLEDPADERAFRAWFTFLAEMQFFQPAAARPAEISDCAALIRYAYREALRPHDGVWATAAHLPLAPALPSVAKYQYPYTPLGANLFRVTGGQFQPADLAGSAFAQFADAQTLQLRNTHFVTRDLAHAQSGDLLFFRQDQDHMPFHSMIYLGASQIEARSAARYVVYHTGEAEMRRPSVEDLLHFPEAEWRPLPDNRRFLGVYRWNILRKRS